MKPRSLIAVVDRIERASVVVELEPGGERVLPRTSLPAAAEGAVFRVALTANGEPDWTTAVRDHSEEARRRDALAKRAERLRKHDSGGDIEL
jgi:hypothetical protein